MWRFECPEVMLSWFCETHASKYMYDPFFPNNAFKAPVGALPLQIGLGVSIEVSFTFSQSFSDSCNFAFLVCL